MTGSTLLRRRVVVLTEHGLHIRPCQVLAKQAQQFRSRIGLSRGEQVVDAKSVFDLMTLGAGPGVELDLEVEGEDAADAIAQLGDLFDARFGIGPEPSPT